MATTRRGAGKGLSAKRAVGVMVLSAVAASMLVAVTGPASAAGPNAIMTDSGCGTNQPAASPSGAVALPFPLVFFGVTSTAVWVNADGNVTFQPAQGTDASLGLPSNIPIIAPFYATTASGTVTYGTITFGGRPAFCVNWLDMTSSQFGVGENSFQLLLVDRSDINPGNFDAIFNYDQVE